MNGQPLFLLPLVRTVSILIGTWLFAQHLPRRSAFVPRFAAIALCIAAAVLFVDWLGFMQFDFLTREHFLAWGIVTRSALLAALVGIVLACFETSAWSALFCSILGFTLEGAAEGLTMVADVAVGVDPSAIPMSAEALSIALCSVLIYLAVYSTYIRAVNRADVEEIDDNRLFAVFIAVVLVTVAFGQITQVLFRSDADRALVAALELVRVALCAFILFAAYEVLYSARLREEVAAIEGLMRSREDQYRISRESIDAINVKCHDIRHQIRGLG